MKACIEMSNISSIFKEKSKFMLRFCCSYSQLQKKMLQKMMQTKQNLRREMLKFIEIWLQFKFIQTTKTTTTCLGYNSRGNTLYWRRENVEEVDEERVGIKKRKGSSFCCALGWDIGQLLEFWNEKVSLIYGLFLL